MEEPLTPGRDFYFEGQFIVFTAEYLKRRGYCCGSGCRHCPFEHVNVADQLPSEAPVDVDPEAG